VAADDHLEVASFVAEEAAHDTPSTSTKKATQRTPVTAVETTKEAWVEDVAAAAAEDEEVSVEAAFAVDVAAFVVPFEAVSVLAAVAA